MVRTVEKKYQVWLAGYYDDFNGARAIPDDRNQPSDTTYSATKSHFGNPMNGEAFLNPRFRFSVEERTLDSDKKITTSSNQYLQNDGIFEWLTFDDTRLSYDDWEGRAQLQYPDGHVANRYKFDNDATYGSDFYQRFINGHNSDASYIVPVGDNDATHGHNAMNRYNIENYGLGSAGLHTTTGNFAQRAHLTGVWMAEKIDYDYLDPEPRQVYQEIYSPSKQPFLCIQSVRKTDTDSASTPSIIYDGHLNSRIDGDIFTARVALQSGKTTGVWDDVGIRFEIGFPVAQAGILNDSGYTGTPAIDFTLDLDAISYDTQALLDSADSYNTPQVTIDNAWLDVDFVFDYTNEKFRAYHNGTEITATNTTAGAYSSSAPKGYDMPDDTTASNLYGYQLTVTNEGSSSTAGYVSYLMIDRVGLVRYLTDDFTVSDEVHIEKMTLNQSINGISNMSLKIADDPKLTGGLRGAASTDYILNLRSLFVASSPLDWSVLVFADKTSRIDRPVWRGEIETFSINQNMRSREINIKANDSLSIIDRQMPLWDVGQKGDNTTEDATDYWSYGAQGLQDSMYLGGAKLKLLGNDVGFDIDSSHLESATQRMQLGSGHPIQMYNNEDEVFGPNSIEDEYEAYGIRGFTQAFSPTAHTIAIADLGTHSITTSTSVTIESNRHNATSITPNNVTGNEIRFDNADLPYSPESSKIVYIGKYPGLEFRHEFFDDSNQINRDDWNEIVELHPKAETLTGPLYMNVYFSSDPNLKVGDYFYINRRNDAGSQSNYLSNSYSGRNRVSRIFKTRSYFSTYIGTGTTDSIWVVRTTTPYSNAESFGNYEGDSLLDGTSRFSWSKDTGRFTGVYGANAEAIKYRALHALWMRDLPKSLWFKYHFGIVKRDPINSATVYLSHTQTIDSSDLSVEIPLATYNAAPNSGVVEIWSKIAGTTYYDYRGKFIYQGKKASGLNYYLIGCKYINFTTTTTSSTSHILKFQDFKDDYKHLWLLWADMRNNGEANADGSTRKEDFGLQYPTGVNYEFDMFYTDQLDEDGELDKFASLKVGDDIDVWNIDSTTDPITSGALSKPADYSAPQIVTIHNASGKLQITTGETGTVAVGDYVHLVGTADHDGIHRVASGGLSNDTHFITETTFVSNTLNTGGAFYYPCGGSEAENLDIYADWEDKAGALVVIDAAKFFNLNTHINSGKTGQDAGGSTDLTDYIATIHGFPSLIDNYWREAMSSYNSIGLEGVTHHTAQRRLISDVTLATYGFMEGEYGLEVDDITLFEDKGAGRVIAVMDRNNNEPNQIEHFFTWNSRLTTAYSSSSGINSLVIPGAGTLFEGQTIVSISNTGETHDAEGVKRGMILKRTPSGGGTVTVHNILGVGKWDDSVAGDLDRTTGNYKETDLVIQRAATDGTAVTWGAGDTYTIPVQLAMIYSTPLDSITTNAAATASLGLSSLEDEVWAHYSTHAISWNNYGIYLGLSTTEGEEDTPISSEVHTTVFSNYMLRLLMHMDGFYKSTNGGTYWESDKVRMLWNAAIMDSWLPSARVNCVFDINNVPITSMMTTYNDITSNDSYGSITDTRNKTLGASFSKIQDTSGYGTTNGLYTSFSYLIGRDNRIEFRPKYNSGLAFNRNNLVLSQINVNLSGQINNVRIYYNDGNSFYDWPATNLSDTTRWKILEYPDINSSVEAETIAQQEYNKYKSNPMSLKASPQLEDDVTHKMIDSGRYGYIADPYIALWGGPNSSFEDEKIENCCNWTVLGTGGVLFPGMVNALDGNMNVDIDPIKDRYGSSTEVAAGGYNLNTGGNTIGWDSNYYWYGSNSISNAIQIVHIPNKTPLVSDATGEHLRMWIDLKSGQSGTDIDNAQFTVYLSDYSFSGITKVATLNNQTTKDVKHSGYYEIAFPSNYGAVANAKIVFSLNAEYCRALLRHRCGDPTASNILTSSQYNTSTTPTANSDGSNCFDGNINSIFPLGQRYYPEMGGGFRGNFKYNNSAVSVQEGRMIWYAPRIQICRDLSYVPATYVSVTDAGLELNSETMVIQNIKWDVAAGKTEDVMFGLERNESVSAGGILSYLFPKENRAENRIGGSKVIKSSRMRSRSTPPSNTPSAITDPSGQQPTGGTSPSTGNAYSTSDGNSINTMSSSAFGRIKGRMNLMNDNLSGNASFSVLGQQKPSITPSTMRSMESEVLLKPTSGAASEGADGYVFGAKGLMGGDSAAASQNVTIQTSFVVPTDILSNRISIEARVTHGPKVANNTTAILYVTAKVKETNETITNTVRIGTGVRKNRISLLPTKPFKGLKQAGNNIEIIITRKAGTGDDNADTTSVTLHNLEVKMQRASANTRSSASYFSPSS